jgi:hypothetical protein
MADVGTIVVLSENIVSATTKNPLKRLPFLNISYTSIAVESCREQNFNPNSKDFPKKRQIWEIIFWSNLPLFQAHLALK